MQVDKRGKIRLFFVDDHALFREGLLRLLAGDPDLMVLGTSGSPEEAFEPLMHSDVDVLVLDYEMYGEPVTPFVRRLRESGFKAKILLVTAGVPDREALELIRLGISGIFLKHNPPEELRRSIHDVYEGRAQIEQRYLQKLMQSAVTVDETLAVRMTQRDRQILRCVIEGLSNKEIAGQLGISESAVKASLQQLFAKTGVRTRSQLVRAALEQYSDLL